MNNQASAIAVLEPPTAKQTHTAPTSPPKQRRGLGAILHWLLQAIPTVLVLGALGGLLYWGHHTGWKLPKFSELNGEGQKEKEDWCAEHSVPESKCVECNPKLLPRPKAHGWCKKHGVAECPLCNPDLAQTKKPVTVTTTDLERAVEALAFAERPENNNKCKKHERRLQFVSHEAVEKMGVDIAPVGQWDMTEAVTAYGEVTYDQTRVAKLSPRFPGAVWRMDKQVGEPVKKGEVLALVDAVEVGKMKAELVQAINQRDIKGKLLRDLQKIGDVAPPRQVSEADLEYQQAHIRVLAAQQELRNLGLPVQADDYKGLPADDVARRLQENLTKHFAANTTTANLLPVVSPLDGVVIARDVGPGAVVDTNAVLFVVADVRQMWLMLDVRPEDDKLLKVGQTVHFKPDTEKETINGTISWIGRAVHENTRTVKVRVDLANPEGRLKAFAYGTGQIVLREVKDTVTVPNEAVHWEGCCNVVFVRDKNYLDKDAPKVFHVRKVRIGAKNTEHTEIIAGVLPGEVVASKGSGALRSELLKNNLGDG